MKVRHNVWFHELQIGTTFFRKDGPKSGAIPIFVKVDDRSAIIHGSDPPEYIEFDPNELVRERIEEEKDGDE